MMLDQTIYPIRHTVLEAADEGRHVKGRHTRDDAAWNKARFRVLGQSVLLSRSFKS